MSFIVGQRWISNSESQLGLGIITEVTRRQIKINFPAAEEERFYAVDNAPLSRIVFNQGEVISAGELHNITVTDINEVQGLIHYLGVDLEGNQVTIDERVMDSFIKLHTPTQRLFSGLIDKLETFYLRIDTLNQISRLAQSPVKGLLGARTNHLPHQVYIASEVAQRHAPRVLLADEVGLGKTIEAGMILHYQLHTGRAQRVLIIVPDSLLYQWLVEMIRRFNLHFSIIDEGNFDQMTSSDIDLTEKIENQYAQNPFESEQLILCSIDFLMNNTEAQIQALAADWDLLIVDEAHYLQWLPNKSSPKYDFVEQLSSNNKGLLLLTATPEQVGIQSHFARLRLLDPHRFHNLEQFLAEETGYQALNKLVQEIVNYEHVSELNHQAQEQLHSYLGPNLPETIEELVKVLIDRHGTGRVLFRNTRAAIHGFPQRNVHSYPLVADDKEQDVRIPWLVQTIVSLFPKKILIICSQAQMALDLEQYLKVKVGIRAAAFHEGLSIIERDRAAAYFAEQEAGAQVLICSEIGSEGRNFQFAHHLVLYDLPLNPDLLEQRIGRLDRIGQQHAVEIHVPYQLKTDQETLFRWYHEGINLFEQSCSIGSTIFEAFAEKLLPLLQQTDEKALNLLIAETKSYTSKINKMLHEGRDRLLEMSSCNSLVAENLIHLIEDEENNSDLEQYMAKVFHEFGIDHEFHSGRTEILHPGEHMKTSHFPGLKEDGVTITYSRTKALDREDIEFLSWEHPMVSESMDMIAASELGNTCLVTLSIKSIKPGTLFLESFFTINCVAPKQLQLDRFLPLAPIRLLLDLSFKNLTDILDYEKLNAMCQPVKKHMANAIIKQIRQPIDSIIKKSTDIAQSKLEQLVEQANLLMREHFTKELTRLLALQKLNPSIREDEINCLKQQMIDGEYYLNHAALNLQAIRVVINK